MRDRTEQYRMFCVRQGLPVLIQPQGVTKMGNVTFGEDGILRAGRRKHGPYMVMKNFGGYELLLKFSEAKNAHRLELARWKILTHVKHVAEIRKQTLTDLKKLIGRRKSAVGLFRNRWMKLTIDSNPLGSFDVKSDVLQITEETILDAIVEFGSSAEEHKLVERFLRNGELLQKWFETAARIDNVLNRMIRELLIWEHQDKRKRDATIEVTINGRRYISVQDHFPPGDPSRGWPSPLNLCFDLDEKAAMSRSSEVASS